MPPSMPPLTPPPAGPAPDWGGGYGSAYPAVGLAGLAQGFTQGLQIGHNWVNEAGQMDLHRKALENEAAYRNAMLREREPYYDAKTREMNAYAARAGRPGGGGHGMDVVRAASSLAAKDPAFAMMLQSDPESAFGAVQRMLQGDAAGGGAALKAATPPPAAVAEPTTRGFDFMGLLHRAAGAGAPAAAAPAGPPPLLLEAARQGAGPVAPKAKPKTGFDWTTSGKGT